MFNYIFLNLLNFMFLMIFILVAVSFLTLFERKVLSYIQFRKGPNKVGFNGILQPFSDAIKLFSKEYNKLNKLIYLYYYLSPMMMLIVSLMMWFIYPYFTMLNSHNFDIMLFLCFLSLGVYFLMFSGWSSYSNYSMLGSLRSISQTISYEVSLIFNLLFVFYMCEELNLMYMYMIQYYLFNFFMLFPIVFMFFISMLAELNRSPFDISEGESELVSGFNTEYFSGSFAMIFMSEYLMIMLLSYLFMMMYFNLDLFKFLNYLFIMLFSFMIIWIRGVLPRIRYDKLMNLIWKNFLPFILLYLVYVIMIKIMLYIYLF